MRYESLPLDWEELPPQWAPLVERARKYKRFEDFLKSFTKAYHGTHRDFIRFNPDVERNDVVIDRYLGVHFAKDRKLAENFARGNAGWHHVGEKRDRGRVLEVFLDIHNPYVLDQTNPYHPDILDSDQAAIRRLVGGVVYPHRKDIFVTLYGALKSAGKEEVGKDWERIKKGEKPRHFSLPESLMKVWNNPWEVIAWNEPVLLFGFDNMDSLGREIAREFRKRMEEAGYDAVVYINTAPMETEGVGDPTSYIVWNPWKILYRSDLERIWAIAHGKRPVKARAMRRPKRQALTL